MNFRPFQVVWSRRLRVAHAGMLFLGVLALPVAGAESPLSGDPPPAEPWIVPIRAAKKLNPEHADANSITVGKRLFERECVACHGAKGLGDGPKAADLERKPGNLASPTMWDQSDGALFWKISEGKAPMPTTKVLLSDDERWHVINYVRTLAPKPTAAEPTPPQFDAPAEFRQAVSTVYRAYRPVSAALAKGDGAGAAKAVAGLSSATDALKKSDPKGLSGPAQPLWTTDVDGCAAAVAKLKAAGEDVAALRLAFAGLSTTLARTASRFGHDEPGPIFVVAPEGAKGDEGVWLQSDPALTDPYAGSGSTAKATIRQRLGAQKKS